MKKFVVGLPAVVGVNPGCDVTLPECTACSAAPADQAQTRSNKHLLKPSSVQNAHVEANWSAVEGRGGAPGGKKRLLCKC